MFTGLVQAVGRVKAVRRGRGGVVRLIVQPGGWDHRPAPGDSIAVNGCCLTVAAEVSAADPVLAFDVVPETLARTALGRLRVGGRVNLEHAATMTTLLGGHLVQGHVDGVGTVVRVDKSDGWRVRVAVPRVEEGRSDPSAGDLMQYILPKGSICVDGVSLTVAALWQEQPRGRGGGGAVRRGFEVALIPTTLTKTTLAGLSRGGEVNLETDAIAKTVVHWVRAFGGAAAESGAPASSPLARPRRARRTG